MYVYELSVYILIFFFFSNNHDLSKYYGARKKSNYLSIYDMLPEWVVRHEGDEDGAGRVEDDLGVPQHDAALPVQTRTLFKSRHPPPHPKLNAALPVLPQKLLNSRNPSPPMDPAWFGVPKPNVAPCAHLDYVPPALR